MSVLAVQAVTFNEDTRTRASSHTAAETAIIQGVVALGQEARRVLMPRSTCLPPMMLQKREGCGTKMMSSMCATIWCVMISCVFCLPFMPFQLLSKTDWSYSGSPTGSGSLITSSVWEIIVPTSVSASSTSLKAKAGSHDLEKKTKEKQVEARKDDRESHPYVIL